jgi:hypothetical protein
MERRPKIWARSITTTIIPSGLDGMSFPINLLKYFDSVMYLMCDIAYQITEKISNGTFCQPGDFEATEEYYEA